MAGDAEDLVRLRADLPELGIVTRGCWSVRCHVKARQDARRRVEWLAGRLDGPACLRLRLAGPALAYRQLARQLGVDPALRPTPIDTLVLERLRAGSVRVTTALAAAQVTAMLETGVSVWVVDARTAPAPLDVAVADGRVVVADGRGEPVAALLGEDVRASAAPGPHTTDALAFAVRAAGIEPAILGRALEIVEDVLALHARG